MSDKVSDDVWKQAIPRPSCCDDAFKCVYFRAPSKFNDGAGWYVSVNSDRLAFDERRDQITSSLRAEFCPFCGERLPEVRKMDDPPEPMMEPNEGKTHCMTCGERICDCYPKAAGYEIVE